jgi:hypothetical protein
MFQVKTFRPYNQFSRTVDHDIVILSEEKLPEFMQRARNFDLDTAMRIIEKDSRYSFTDKDGNYGQITRLDPETKIINLNEAL